VLFGVFMMRWNVVIGGQSFSLTFSGYMHYMLPVVPHDWDTFKEGLGAFASSPSSRSSFLAAHRIFPVSTTGVLVILQGSAMT